MKENLQYQFTNLRRRGRGETKRPLLFLLYFGSLLGFCLFYPLSGNWERLLEEKNTSALLEILAVLFPLFLLNQFRKKAFISHKEFLGAVGAVLIFELYIHRMVLPFLISGIYFLLLSLVFMVIFGEKDRIISFWRNKDSFFQEYKDPSLYELIYALPFLIIQLNRMNIAADYDSLRYGLRSQYVLFNGSFFSALGQINAVYSYPKGLEVLTAPLSTFHSFALLFMFQFWTMIGIAILLYSMVLRRMGKREPAVHALLILFMLCSVTNMSITAKTDLLTLFFQLLMLWYFQEKERGKATAAAIFTYSLKPTAVVFTTLSYIAMLLGSLFWEWKYGEKGHKNSGENSLILELRSGLPALLFCILFTGIITLRTLLITGVPISTTFTALFQKMGFHVKWPFNLDAHVDYTGEASPIGAVISVLRRMILLLFCPVGEDMLHVAIAWGGVWVPILLYFAFSNLFKDLSKRLLIGQDSDRRNDDKERIYQNIILYWNFLIITGFSILSLFMLWQIDGNYYILFDLLLILTAFSYEDKRPLRGKRRLLTVIPLYVAALLTTVITSWSGAVGFTPIDLINKGYYDNIAEIRQEELEKGSYEFWTLLSGDPKNRVLSFLETPDAYKMLCNVQSITDVEGSGGSPGLYDDPVYFEWFLSWAETDYVYLKRSFLLKEESVRNREILPALISDGMLLDGSAQGEYMLFRVNQERLQYVWDEVPKPALDVEKSEEMLALYENWLRG